VTISGAVGERVETEKRKKPNARKKRVAAARRKGEKKTKGGEKREATALQETWGQDRRMFLAGSWKGSGEQEGKGRTGFKQHDAGKKASAFSAKTEKEKEIRNGAEWKGSPRRGRTIGKARRINVSDQGDPARPKSWGHRKGRKEIVEEKKKIQRRRLRPYKEGWRYLPFKNKGAMRTERSASATY